MVKYIFAVLLLSAVLAPAAPGRTLDFDIFKGPEITIRYETPLEKVVPEVAGIYPKIKSELEEKINLNITFKPNVFLIHSVSEFQKMVHGNELVTAFAVSKNNTIVIDYSKMQSTPFNLELTLKHELCHLLLYNYIRRGLLPKWLNEGVSQWVSEGTADIISFDGKKLLKQAALSNGYLPLNRLETQFPSDKDLFILSYEQSRSIVEYIDSKYGTEKLLDILEMLHKGSDIEKAVFAGLSVDINELETQWHKYLRRKYTWASYISDNIYWIIFFAGAVATVIGFLKLRKRIKEYPDEDEEEFLDS